MTEGVGSSAGVLIVSEADDLHARAVQDEIKRRGEPCFLIGSDELWGSESFNIFLEGGQASDIFVRTVCGRFVSPADAGAIWWRRYRAPQKAVDVELSANEASLVSNDCVAALRGSLEASFQGSWISHPTATERASNKILQLHAARDAGFRIPATLISQSPSAVREFVAQYGSVIYKPVAGTRGPLLFTRFVTDEILLQGDAIRSSPTIFQEYVPGELHIRLNCFGNRSFASAIESDALDWRPNLDVPIRDYAVGETLDTLVQRTLRGLGLAMGIFDIKVTPGGEFVFLEVNPQGQFLFLEAATGQPLARHMADYLVAEAHGFERRPH